jgi:hypothetical protein
LYHDARDSFSYAAALRDADAAQFDPKYGATLAAINALKAFNDHSVLGVDNHNAASNATENLELCVSRLQAYHLPIPNDLNVAAVRSRLNQRIDNCVANGRIDALGDMK